METDQANVGQLYHIFYVYNYFCDYTFLFETRDPSRQLVDRGGDIAHNNVGNDAKCEIHFGNCRFDGFNFVYYMHGAERKCDEWGSRHGGRCASVSEETLSVCARKRS